MRWLKALDERTPFGVKLAGAFAAIIVIGVVVVYLTLQDTMLNTFAQYADETSVIHARGMAPFFAYYYGQNGDWEGVGRLLSAMSSAHGPLGEHLVLVDAAGHVLGPSDSPLHDHVLERALINQGAPVMVDGHRVGTLLANLGSAPPQLLAARFSDSIRRSIAGAALAAAGVALLLGVLTVRQLTRPLRQLSHASHAVAAGGLDRRVDIRSRDVLGQLGADFNTMAGKLERSEALRRRMIADIAHELRTPLTVLQGNLQGLKEGVFEPEPAYLASLHDESQLLGRLVNDLRDLSLAEAGELVLERVETSIADLFQRALQPLKPLLDSQRIVIESDIPLDLPPVWVDPDRMNQVLNNLLSNAARHAPEGGAIALRAERRDGHVRIAVSDTGSGIAPEDLPNVFERFWRADESRARRSGGSGLGLAIVKNLVEAHGGSVGVDSALGSGTTFYVTLPVGREGQSR